MYTVPTSWLISILAVFIAAAVVSRPRLPVAARALFGPGLCQIAAVTVFVGLRLEYGFEGLSRVQPHIATLIAPSLWVGFQSLTSTTGTPNRPSLQLVVLSIIVAEFAPVAWSVDVVVIAIDAVYAILLTTMLRLPTDAFVQIAPSKSRLTRLALLFALFFVVLIIAADTAIFVAVLSAGNSGLIHLLTGISGVAVAVVLLCTLIGVPLVLGTQTADVSRKTATQVPLEEDQELLRKLDHLMIEHQISNAVLATLSVQNDADLLIR